MATILRGNSGEQAVDLLLQHFSSFDIREDTEETQEAINL